MNMMMFSQLVTGEEKGLKSAKNVT